MNFKRQNIVFYSELDSFGSSTVSGQKQHIETPYLFFPNDKVYRYFSYPVIFHNLLAA